MERLFTQLSGDEKLTLMSGFVLQGHKCYGVVVSPNAAVLYYPTNEVHTFLVVEIC